MVTIDTTSEQSSALVLASVAAHLRDAATATEFLAAAAVTVDETPQLGSRVVPLELVEEAAQDLSAPQEGSGSGGGILPVILVCVALVMGVPMAYKIGGWWRRERYRRQVDERLGTGALEIVNSPLHSVQLFGMPERLPPAAPIGSMSEAGRDLSQFTPSVVGPRA